MKNKKLTKFLVPLLMVLALAFNINKVEAQSTCATAVVFTPTAIYQSASYNITDTVYWFKFTAADTALTANVVNKYGSSNASITSVSLYQGSCKSLTLLQTSGVSDSLIIFKKGLTIGAVYYIKVKRTATNSGSFWFGHQYYVSYNVQLYCPPPCRQKVSNGYFESTWQTLGFQYLSPFGPIGTGCPAQSSSICGWSRASGTPNFMNYTISGPVHYGRMWAATVVSDTLTESLRNQFALPLAPGNYTLKFSYRVTQQYSNTATLNYLRARLTSQTLFTPGCNNANPILPTLPTTDLVYSTGAVPINQFGSWHSVTQNITVTATNYSSIVFYSSSNATSNLNVHLIDLDSVSLVQTYNTNVTDTFCSGSVNVLYPTLTGYPNYTYLWSTGATTSTISVAPTTNTTYYCTVTDAQPCSIIDTINLVVTTIDPPLFTGFTNTCDSITFYTITNYDSLLTYSYYIDNGTPIVIPAGTNPFPVDLSSYYSTGATLYLIVSDPSGNCHDTTSLFLHACCLQPGAPHVLNNTDAVTSLPGGTFFTGFTYYINGTFTVNKNVTLTKCRLWMAPDAQIVVAPTFTFTLDSCYLDAYCDTMWDGIYVQSNNSTLNLKNADTLRRAKNAVVSENGGNYKAWKCLFEDNYIGAIIRNWTGTYANSIFSNTKFRSTGTALLPPYATNMRGVKGIEVESVTNLCIGDTMSYSGRNTFYNLDYGITSNRTNIKVYNNNFNRIDNCTPGLLPTPPPVGTCVAVRSAGSLIVNAIVGGINIPGSIKSNRMDSCLIGIHGYFNLNHFKCEYDSIYSESCGVANATTPIGIYSYAPNINNINVKYCRIFNGSYGIIVQDIKANSKLNIKNNIVQNPNKMGINVSNAISTTPYAFQIANNRVNFPNTYTSSVTGIRVVNVQGISTIFNYKPYAIITTDTVIFSNPNLSYSSYGIRVQNSPYVSIELNYVRNAGNAISDSTNAKKLNGIVDEVSHHSYLCKNKVARMGCGLRFYGNNLLSKIQVNTMDTTYIGIRLDTANVGNQYFSATQGNGNMWNGTQYKRLQGTWTLVRWYSHVNANLTLVPIPNYVALTPPATPTQIYNVTSFISNCSTSPITMLAPMQEIVNNQTVYPILPDENAYTAKTTAFTTMKTDTLLKQDLINADPVFETFYNVNEAGNVGKISTINDMISVQDYNGAITLNNALVPINLMEQSRKDVNEIYLNTWAQGRFEFTSTEYSTLYNLAAQRPVIYGDAVYTARVMIGEEGSSMDSYRLIHPENNNQLQLVIGKIYPNPTKDEAYLDYKLEEGQSGVIDIYTITGQLLFEKVLNNNNSKLIINTSNLNSGLYFYKVIVDETIIVNEKLMIIK